MSKLDRAAYNEIGVLWKPEEQSGTTFDAKALADRWPDVFVSRLPTNAIASVLLGGTQKGVRDEPKAWWVHQWVADRTQGALTQGRHVARAQAEAAQFCIDQRIPVAYGAVPDVVVGAYAITWFDALLAPGVVEDVPTVSGKLYRVYPAPFLPLMQARS